MFLFFWSYTKHHKFNCESFLLTERKKCIAKFYLLFLFAKGGFIFDCRKSSFFLVVSGKLFS